MDLRRLRELFIVRDDTYVIQDYKDKVYTRINGRITDTILKKHLNGEISLQIYPINSVNVSKWICYDFDYDGERQIKKLFNYLSKKSEYKNSFLIEDTGSRGFHFWIFFTPTKARYLRFIGMAIAENANLGLHELFPKHDYLSETVKYSNPIRLPFGIHPKTNKRSEMLYPSNLDEIVPVELPDEVKQTIDELLQQNKKDFEKFEKIPGKIAKYPWWNECAVYKRIYHHGVPEGFRDESAFFLARVFREQGLTAEQAYDLLVKWNERNNPPLNKRTLRTKIRQAYGRKYAVGFRSIIKNSVLKIFCPEDCDKCKYSQYTRKRLNSLKKIIQYPL